MAKTKASAAKAFGPGSFAHDPKGLDELLTHMAPGRTVESLEEEGLTPEEARVAEAERDRQLMMAEREDAAREARVNMRWGKDQLGVIQRAASLTGVPYQTYVKMVAFRAAITDLAAADKVGIR